MKHHQETGADGSLPIMPGHTSPGRLERILRADQFAVTAEIAPPDSADPNEVFQRARIFDGCVDAINATDGSGANCHMSSVGVCSLLTREGYATIMQVSCRDRNRIAMQGDILGAAAMGVTSVLCLTGDGVQAGDQPNAKPVFDYDCMSLLENVCTMRDDGRLSSGRRLTAAPKLFIGGAANPFAPPFEFRVDRLAKKVAAGAQFVQTQYCFDIEMLERFMEHVRRLGLHKKVFILVGVGPLASAKAARWIRANVPGIHIPDHIVQRLDRARKPKLEGQNICMETIGRIRKIDGIHGVHVMAYRQEEAVARIIRASGVLKGRVPWHPHHDTVAPEQRAAS